MRNIIISLIGLFFLISCSKQVYNPNDFVTPNRVVEKDVKVSAIPEPQIKATYGIGNDALVEKAYNKYLKTGRLETITTHGWVTYPYSPDTKPVIECQPLRLCVVQLEDGEKLNSVNVGNSQDWLISEFLTGEGKNTAVSVIVKPAKYNIATDLIISTNKRTYNIGLVSKYNANVAVLRFYYPEETRIASIIEAQNQQRALLRDKSRVVSTRLANNTAIDINKINFNYKIKGDNPVWRPLRIFDDNNKTYIEMPAVTSLFELPVLYLARNKQFQMVNYRYEKPYFVIDGLFSRAWLISGKGREQQRVEILNQNIKG